MVSNLDKIVLSNPILYHLLLLFFLVYISRVFFGLLQRSFNISIGTSSYGLQRYSPRGTLRLICSQQVEMRMLHFPSCTLS
jgi:hypothetical protein